MKPGLKYGQSKETISFLGGVEGASFTCSLIFPASGMVRMTQPASMGESVFICGRNPLIGSLKNDIFVSFWGLLKTMVTALPDYL
jgi:hypothetical protein